MCCRISGMGILVSICLAVICFSGCATKRGDPGEGGLLDPGAEQRKQEALAAVGAAFEGFAHTSREEDNRALVDLLQANATFSSVEAGDALIIATFFDGEEIDIINDIPYDELMALAASAPTAKSVARASRAKSIRPLMAAAASDTRLVVVNACGESIEAVIVRPYLNSIVSMGQKLGYTVLSPDFNTYDGFKNSFKNMDGLVWFGHAGAQQGKFRFVLPSFPDLTKDHPEIGTTLRRTVLVEMDLAGQHIVIGEKFAVTEDWVAANWTFKPGGMLMMNLCESAAEDAKFFRTTCNSVGMEAYFGWSGVTAFKDMGETATVLADMLMGANVKYSSYHPNAGSDPSRAWSYMTTLNNLKTINRKEAAFFPIPFGGYSLTRSFSGPLADVESNLVYLHAHGSDTGNADVDSAWVPGITTLTTAEADSSPSELSIVGSFTDKQGGGKATINGNDLAIIEWLPSRITCEISNDGEDASGTVVVESNGRRSNPVNLTSWRGPIRYTERQQVNDQQNVFGDVSRKFSMSVRMRADVHSFRNDPSSPPVWLEPAVAAMAGVSSLDSYNAEGSLTNVLLDDNHQKTGTSGTTFSRNDAVSATKAFAEVPGKVGFSMVFKPAEQSAKILQCSVSIPFGEHGVYHYKDSLLERTEEYDQAFLLFFDRVLALISPTTTLNTESFDTGSVSGDSSESTTFVGDNGDSIGSTDYSIQVGPFTAEHPPDSEAAR